MRPQTRAALDPSVAIVSKRLALRLAIVLMFAALPVAHGIGFAKMFILLTGVNALTSAAMAVFRREPFHTRALTHWDEALVMAALFTMAGVAT